MTKLGLQLRGRIFNFQSSMLLANSFTTSVWTQLERNQNQASCLTNLWKRTLDPNCTLNTKTSLTPPYSSQASSLSICTKTCLISSAISKTWQTVWTPSVIKIISPAKLTTASPCNKRSTTWINSPAWYVPKPSQTLICTAQKPTSLQTIIPEVTVLFIKCSSLTISNTSGHWKPTNKPCVTLWKIINCMKTISSLRTYSSEVRLTHS